MIYRFQLCCSGKFLDAIHGPKSVRNRYEYIALVKVTCTDIFDDDLFDILSAATANKSPTLYINHVTLLEFTIWHLRIESPDRAEIIRLLLI